MDKGIESLKEAVMKDCAAGENCFNPSGCDHEFTRIEPETNPKLIEMGITRCCKRVCKCFHKYCDKYKWVMERAALYAEKTGKTVGEVIEIWERARTYWYLSYYQGCNQPIPDEKAVQRFLAIEIRYKNEKIALTSSALKNQSEHYPPVWKGKVPKRVKMAKTVTSDLPIFLQKTESIIAEGGKEYYVYCNSHGAISAILPNGEKLGLKPYEFEVIEWHTSNQ